MQLAYTQTQTCDTPRTNYSVWPARACANFDRPSSVMSWWWHERKMTAKGSRTCRAQHEAYHVIYRCAYVSLFSACSFGWWLMAGADLFWEKSTVGWLMLTGLFWEKSTAGWWLISQANKAFLGRTRSCSCMPQNSTTVQIPFLRRLHNTFFVTTNHDQQKKTT
jgi:hypothetical protein